MAPPKKKRTQLPAGISRRADEEWVIRVTAQNRATKKRVDRMKVLDRELPLSEVVKTQEEMKAALQQEIDQAVDKAVKRGQISASRKGPAPLSPETTFADYTDLWIARRSKRKMRAYTVEVKISILAHHVLPYLGELTLAEIDRPTMVAFRTHLEDQGEALGHSLITVRHRWKSALHVLRDGLADLGLPDPTHRLEMPEMRRQAPKREQRTLTPEQVHRVCAKAEELKLPQWIMVPLLAYSGMRRGEAVALRWVDLDLEVGTATVERSAVLLRDGRWQMESPKSGKARITGLPQVLREALSRWRDHHPPKTETDLIMSGPSGRIPPHRQEIDRDFRRLNKALDELAVHVTPQVLRRTWNTHAGMIGVDPSMKRSMIGHSSESMSDLYNGPTPANTASVASRMWDSHTLAGEGGRES